MIKKKKKAKKKEAEAIPEADLPPRSGILGGGNFIVDYVKIIDRYPEEEMLVNIIDQATSNGGGPYNMLKDLAKMGADFPLQATGRVGDDENARWILSDCDKHNISTAGLRLTSQAPTSYTDAFSVASSGKRTFFHQRGANALLSAEDFDFSKTRAKIFYFGFLLLLDSLDRLDDEGRTGASRVLEAASEQGLLTCADAVSTEHPQFAEIVKSSIPYLDFLVLNEIEAGKVYGTSLRTDESLDWEEAEKACKFLLGLGVKRLAVIHFKEGAVAATPDGPALRQSSLNLPDSYVKGSSGAGDAFAAGMLYGLHEGWDTDRCLQLAMCTAASSLSKPPPSEGILPLDDCIALAEQFGWR